MEKETNLRKASFFMAVGGFFGACTASVVKELTFFLSIFLIFFLTRLFSLIGMIPLFLQKRWPLKSKHPFLVFLFSFFYLLGMFCFLSSLYYVPIVNASLLINSAPLYVPFFSNYLLQEKIVKKEWLGIIISFIGVVVVLNPTAELFSFYSILPFFGGISMALSQTINRLLVKKNHPSTIVFYLMLYSVCLSFIPLLFLGIKSAFFPLFEERMAFWLMLLCIGGISTWIFQYFRTIALRYGKVGQVMPFSFLAVIFVGFFGWYFFKEVPSLSFLIGALILIVGLIIVLKTEPIKK